MKRQPDSSTRKCKHEPASGSNADPTHCFALPPGTRIGSYRVLQLLGAGGTGLTYLCEDVRDGRRFAVKELLPKDFAVRGPELTVVARTGEDVEDLKWARDRFIEEGRILGRFNHPGIVRTHEQLEANDTVYLVMDFYPGETWNQILRRERVQTEAEVKAFLLPLLDALREVHRANLIHRDVKPSNIYLTDDGQPMLLDFGAARNIGARANPITSIVTAGYSPIEQYHNHGNQGPWTDIYALAAVAHRALTGEAPPEAIRRERNDPYVPLEIRLKGKGSPEFFRAIDRALNPHERLRPQSVEAWARELFPKPAEIETPRLPKTKRAFGFSICALFLAAAIALLFVTGWGERLLSLIEQPEPEPKQQLPPAAEPEPISEPIRVVPDPPRLPGLPPPAPAIPIQLSEGAKLYAEHCGSCHFSDGSGASAKTAPALAGSEIVNESAELLALVVLNGITPDAASYEERMASWKWKLSDDEIAAILTYIRSNFGNASPSVSAAVVREAREQSKESVLPIERSQLP